MINRLIKLETSIGVIDKLEKEIKQNSKEHLQQIKNLEETLGKTEEKVLREAKTKVSVLEKELGSTKTLLNSSKVSMDEISRRIDKMQHEEEAARAVRRDQNNMSYEDTKKDFVKLQEQSHSLEEKILTLQKLSESTSIESRNKSKYS